MVQRPSNLVEVIPIRFFQLITEKWITFLGWPVGGACTFVWSCPGCSRDRKSSVRISHPTGCRSCRWRYHTEPGRAETLHRQKHCTCWPSGGASAHKATNIWQQLDVCELKNWASFSIGWQNNSRTCRRFWRAAVTHRGLWTACTELPQQRTYLQAEPSCRTNANMMNSSQNRICYFSEFLWTNQKGLFDFLPDNRTCSLISPVNHSR